MMPIGNKLRKISQECVVGLQLETKPAALGQIIRNLVRAVKIHFYQGIFGLTERGINTLDCWHVCSHLNLYYYITRDKLNQTKSK